jgi:hypothetical protein
MTKMLVFTRTLITPKMKKKAGLRKTSMRRTLSTMEKQRKRPRNRKLSPKRANLVAGTKKKSK